MNLYEKMLGKTFVRRCFTKNIKTKRNSMKVSAFYDLTHICFGSRNSPEIVLFLELNSLKLLPFYTLTIMRIDCVEM